MASEATVYRVREIISTIFNLSLEQVPPDASNKSIERWDSMGHLLVVLELEQAFETQLSPEQTEQMTSIPAIAAIIDAA